MRFTLLTENPTLGVRMSGGAGLRAQHSVDGGNWTMLSRGPATACTVGPVCFQQTYAAAAGRIAPVLATHPRQEITARFTCFPGRESLHTWPWSRGGCLPTFSNPQVANITTRMLAVATRSIEDFIRH